ncbi:MAG: DNA gyrase inhibitor YacG [Desulfuromonas sp.]|nr:MAG: DNA gyrase inhibitor YacG [Desulfuromonas sp.]
MTDKKVHRLRVTCPQCRKVAEYHGNPDRPFCSERCRLIDLGKWADESYRLAGERVPTEPHESLEES